MAVVETRQGVGFPDWEIVTGSDRLFDWYGHDVTELAFVLDGRPVRLAVCDRTRRVIRSGSTTDTLPVNLGTVEGLVRRFYGPDCSNHTEYYVAR